MHIYIHIFSSLQKRSSMTNRTRNSTVNSAPWLIEPVDLWYWSIRSFISILTIAGNGLVIYFISSKRRLRVTNNWFVLSLATADLCVGLFTTSSGMACTFHFRCDPRLQVVSYNFLFLASSLNLWAMAIDRYIGTVYSLRYATLMTTARVIIMLASAWCVSFAAAFVRLFWIYDKRLSRKIDGYYGLFVDLFLGILSCVVLLAIYFRILAISRKLARITVAQRQQVAFNTTGTTKSRFSPPGRSSAQVLGAVVVLFVLCYTLNIYFSFCRFSGLCTRPPLGINISLLLVHLNSAVNFAVYAFMKKDIRAELRNLCKWHQAAEVDASCEIPSTCLGA